jgi:hypothetical protein
VTTIDAGLLADLRGAVFMAIPIAQSDDSAGGEASPAVNSEAGGMIRSAPGRIIAFEQLL